MWFPIYWSSKKFMIPYFSFQNFLILSVLGTCLPKKMPAPLRALISRPVYNKACDNYYFKKGLKLCSTVITNTLMMMSQLTRPIIRMQEWSITWVIFFTKYCQKRTKIINTLFTWRSSACLEVLLHSKLTLASDLHEINMLVYWCQIWCNQLPIQISLTGAIR